MAGVTASKYTIVDLLSALASVKNLEERMEKLGWDGLLRFTEAGTVESARQKSVMRLSRERRELLANIDRSPSVKRLRHFQQAEGDDIEFYPWLETQVARLCILMNDDAGEVVGAMSPVELGDALVEKRLVKLHVAAENEVGTNSKQIPDALAGKSRKEIYEHLLCEFRREHASRRKGSILLQLVGEKVFQLQKELLPKKILFCEAKVLEQKVAPIGEPCNLYCDGFRVVCVPYTSEVLQNSEQSQFDRDALTSWGKFSDLATHAGAQLSKTFREVMPGSGENPLTNWLQLMFCTLREQIDLESAYGDCCNLSHIPFSDAADVIEQCRLNTSAPILPPLLQERKERADAIPEAPDKAKNEPTTEELERETPAHTVDSDAPQGDDETQPFGPAGKQSMSVDEANEKAMKLAKADPSFVDKPQRGWADAVGCSPATIGKTDLWEETMDRTDRGRKDKPKKPETVSFTDAVEATQGEGERHEILNQVIREQEADHEASPLDSEGKSPVVHRD